MEMKYYRDVLRPLVESGDVINYELQKTYELQPEFVHDNKKVKAITYVADYYIQYNDGNEIVIDIKGCPDPKALIKRKMFWYRYPDIDYQWLCFSKIDGGWCTYEYVKKQRAERRKTRKAQEELKEKQNE